MFKNLENIKTAEDTFWLVKNHSLLSDVAFKKDFPDMAKEAEDFRKSIISGTAGADGERQLLAERGDAGTHSGT